MKHKMIALALLTSASIASAQSVSTGVAVREMANGSQEHQTSLSARTGKIFGEVRGDIAFVATQKDSNNALSNRVEVGLSHPFSIPSVSFLTANMRVATGWKQVSGRETTTYYVIEPSVTAPIGTNFDVRVGYRWRQAYDSSVADDSTTTRLSASYKITKKDRIALNYDISRGDGANKQTALVYTRAF